MLELPTEVPLLPFCLKGDVDACGGALFLKVFTAPLRSMFLLWGSLFFASNDVDR